MSSFRTTFSDTLAAARQRAARSGDTVRSLLSPSASSGASTGSTRPSGVTFASLGRTMAGLSSSSSEGEGGSGEFSSKVAGGGLVLETYLCSSYPQSRRISCVLVLLMVASSSVLCLGINGLWRHTPRRYQYMLTMCTLMLVTWQHSVIQRLLWKL
jgi:hypothetical protein